MTKATPPTLPAEMATTAKFSAFNLVDTTYKTVNNTPIPVTLLIPKTIRPGKCLVHVRFHGGCLIAGHRMYPDWFGEWTLQLALTRNAVIITPDYRLMPEATGMDILEDLHDFYDWLFKPDGFGKLLPDGVQPDLDHVLITGESAGGWLVLQSTLIKNVKERIAVAVAQYPMIDLRDGHYTSDYHKDLFTPPVPQLDRGILAQYLETMDKKAVITSGTPPDRLDLVLSILQQGKFGTVFGGEEALYPLEALKSIDSLPPTWVLHGTADTVVPVEGTRKWEMAVKKRFADAKIKFHYEEGAEHGFDNAEGVSLETDWVKEGVDFIGKFWPRG